MGIELDPWAAEPEAAADGSEFAQMAEPTLVAQPMVEPDVAPAQVSAEPSLFDELAAVSTPENPAITLIGKPDHLATAEPGVGSEAVVVGASAGQQPRGRLNPWVTALWWLTLPCLGAGAALVEMTDGLAAVAGATLTSIGSMGLVGAFLVAGLDWRLRRLD